MDINLINKVEKFIERLVGCNVVETGISKQGNIYLVIECYDGNNNAHAITCEVGVDSSFYFGAPGEPAINFLKSEEKKPRKNLVLDKKDNVIFHNFGKGYRT